MKSFLIVFLVFTSSCFSQKLYHFDYLLEYEGVMYLDSTNKATKKVAVKYKVQYLTNSKNSNFLIEIREADSANFKFFFRDSNTLQFRTMIPKREFIAPETIVVDCDKVNFQKNYFAYQTKNYDFFTISDTIINDKTFGRYLLKSIKPNRAKRKKLATEYYIIDKSTDFHSPILSFITAYEEWKSNNNLANGILVEKYLQNYSGQISRKEKLIKYQKVDITFIIPEECDFSKRE